MGFSSTAAIVAASASAASAGIGAYSAIQAGEAQAEQAEFQQRQMAIREQQERTAAAQEEAARRAALTDSLQTIEAIRGARGLAFGSPTGMALFDTEIRDESANIQTGRTNRYTQADQYRMGGIMAGNAAGSARLGGYLGAAGSIAGGVSSAAKLRMSLLGPALTHEGSHTTGRQ